MESEHTGICPTCVAFVFIPVLHLEGFKQSCAMVDLSALGHGCARCILYREDAFTAVLSRNEIPQLRNYRRSRRKRKSKLLWS